MFGEGDLGHLHIQELWQKIRNLRLIFTLELYFSNCSLCIYWAPSEELQEGAPFLDIRILSPYIFRSYDKNFQKSKINSCFVLCILVFAPKVNIECAIGSLHIQELCYKISEVYHQYLLCCLHFSICSLGIYWAPSRELQEGAPFLGNGVLAPYIFRSNDKKFQKSTINICFVVCILVFAP